MEGTTLVYAAPEVISLQSREQIHQASDVYSLGITMAELLTGVAPFEAVEKDDPAMNTVMDATYNEQSLLTAICHSHLRPPLDTTRFGPVSSKEDSAIQAWKALIARCWSPGMKERPSIQQVSKELVRILSDILQVDHESIDRNKLLVTKGKGPELQPTKLFKQDSLSELPPPPSLTKVTKIQSVTSISIGSFATSGRRGPDKMEDRHSVASLVMPDGQTQATVIVVLDGHGGQGAAEFSLHELGPAIMERLATQAAGHDMGKLLQEAFMVTDSRFLALQQDDSSGTTALAAIILSKGEHIERIVVANSGDCRAIVAERQGRSWTPVRLSVDHNTDNAKEKERVEKAGGKIVPDAQGFGRIQGHIQITRSLGDRAMKKFGVIATPEIVEMVPQRGKHDFLVIGSDGLFDFLSDEAVVKGVLDTAKEPGLSAKRLGSESIARGSTDNVTSVVVFMRTWNENGTLD